MAADFGSPHRIVPISSLPFRREFTEQQFEFPIRVSEEDPIRIDSLHGNIGIGHAVCRGEIFSKNARAQSTEENTKETGIDVFHWPTLSVVRPCRPCVFISSAVLGVQRLISLESPFGAQERRRSVAEPLSRALFTGPRALHRAPGRVRSDETLFASQSKEGYRLDQEESPAIIQAMGGSFAGRRAQDAAWRRAVESWLHRNGAITVSVDGRAWPCSP